MERLTWKCAFDGEAHCQDGHERLVGHRVDHSPDDRLLIPPPGDVPVDEIRQPGVCKEPDGPDMLVVKDEVADDGRRHESREREKVRDVVDILVGRELREDFEEWFLGLLIWLSAFISQHRLS